MTAEETRPTAVEDETLDALVKRHTLATLERHGGNKGATADALGICLKTLYNWLNKWETDGNNGRSTDGAA